MKKTCRYYVSPNKCLVDGKEPKCKDCDCYVKDDYINLMLKKYGRNNS